MSPKKKVEQDKRIENCDKTKDTHVQVFNDGP